ncbi:MAG: phage tail protein [Deltaproteobacteria bacterium]|nr:phage tail protein [Deltaproteobacteria bacterium]
MSDLGSYGPVVFETSDARILTFADFRDRRRARYATHDVINQEQLLQFLTVELAVVRFEMTLHHRFCDPAAEFQRLLDLLEEHTAHQLVIGGSPLGEFVLEEIHHDWRVVAANGVLMHTKGDVDLRQYR